MSEQITDCQQGRVVMIRRTSEPGREKCWGPEGSGLPGTPSQGWAWQSWGVNQIVFPACPPPLGRKAILVLNIFNRCESH